MANVFSPYKLIDTQIIELKIIIDPKLSDLPLSKENNPLSFNHDFTLHTLDDGSYAGQLVLAVNYQIYHAKPKGSRKKPKEVVELHCILRGIISANFDENLKEYEIEYLLHVNATSLLYAEARTIFMQLSARSPVGMIILPTINPYALVDDYKDRNITAD
jgi:hypothetical protein